MVTIHELEKLGVFRNVYEEALDLSYKDGAKNPGKILNYYVLHVTELVWG